MKNLIYKSFATVITLIFFLPTMAQGPGGGPPQTPIDGGLGILLAAGGAYGIKKIRDHMKDGK